MGGEDMDGPEGVRPRHGMFRMFPTRKETSTPALPKPLEILPAPVSPESEKSPKIKKPWIQRLAGNLALRWIALGGIALAGTGTAYLGIPAVYRYVDNLLGIVSAKDVPDTFDKADDKGLIGNNNMILANLLEIQSQFPEQIVAEGNRISFLFPFQLPDGTVATYVKSLSDRLPTEEIRRQAETANIKDHIDFVLPKGTVIVSPVDGHVLVAKGRTSANEDPSMSPMTWIFYYDEKQNITYQLWFFTSDSSGLSPLIEMQEFTPDTAKGTNWQNLPDIQQGSPMVRTTENGQQLNLNIKAYWGTVIGPQAEIVDKTVFLVTPQFFSSSGSSGQEQLVSLQQN